MRITDFTNRIYTKLDATKLVSKANISKNDLNRLFAHIDFINERTADQLDLGNRSMANYRVPAQLVPFFWPEAVVFDAADRRSVNLLKREEPESSDTSSLLQYDEFLILCDQLLSCYKKSVDATVTLEEIRNVRNLHDVISCMSVKGFVHDQNGVGWYPYPMVDGIELYGKSYYNASENEVFDEMVRGFAKLFA